MARSKESKADEYYLGQIRDLKKQNKQLKMHIKALERQTLYRPIGTRDKAKVEPEANKKQETICPECFRGKLQTLDIIGRVFVSCNICDYRKKIK